MQLIEFVFLFESRKTSQDKKNQDFGNIFSFPSYSQKTDDGEHVFTYLFSLIATVMEYIRELMWHTRTSHTSYRRKMSRFIKGKVEGGSDTWRNKSCVVDKKVTVHP